MRVVCARQVWDKSRRNHTIQQGFESNDNGPSAIIWALWQAGTLFDSIPKALLVGLARRRAWLI